MKGSDHGKPHMRGGHIIYSLNRVTSESKREPEK